MEKDIQNALRALRSGGTILYPTDTVWGIGCDATNKAAVDKVNKIKQRKAGKGYILLMEDLDMVSGFIPDVSETARQLLNSDTPTSLIFSGTKGLPKNVLAEDGSAAVRIPQNALCIKLIREFGKPIVSSSANIRDEPAPASFEFIDKQILSAVDYVITLQNKDVLTAKPSRVVKVDAVGNIQIIRKS